MIFFLYTLTLTVPKIFLKIAKKKIPVNFTFTLLLPLGTPKGFIRAVEAFIKPFEVLPKSTKIKLRI